MIKQIIFVCLTLILLTSCQDEIIAEQTLPKQTIANPYATKQILVLSKLTTYKALLIEQITKRLSKTYSFTIDDLETIYNYNFTNYKSVILLETPLNNTLPSLEAYFQDFAGVNNITIVAVADQTFVPSSSFECLVVSANTENIIDTAEIVIEKIRTKK